MVFTEAHSSSSVCMPTRYGILTGRDNWRRLRAGVFSGYSPPLIAEDRLTVPVLLKQHGYATTCIGKWHLGTDFDPMNPMAPVSNGPITRGFSSYFGTGASLDMPPFAFIENNRLTEAPTVEKKFGGKGAAAPGFEAMEVLPTLARRASEYIATKSKESTPVFLYMPQNPPHAPILPTKGWRGKGGISAYGDFVMKTDWALGEVHAALEKAGIADSALIFSSSDNGCARAANVRELESKEHF